ncbi:murein hydrolase activator EnvC family protein [Aliidiomarina quisquiliarum]|uniref:murein hydrolase activator EnvC family protein n=1 Tax=Aliidiomarina quisquiliarum TaxID=2938947 RepID=UPI00208F4EDF|nr:peptidoglycan DD-metalloendopeptidase family protein [Aliidiomarina quisquiliarum]MCO4322197.1 peptidoglycan DD-metalloendopeptidase family protein [Aliidiomarina quisquiliarum]
MTARNYALACVFFLCLSLAFTAVGAQQSDARQELARTEQQLRDLQKNIAQQRRQFERRQQQLTSTEKALRDIEQNIATSTQALRRTEQEMGGIEARIRELEEEQNLLQLSLQQQAGVLADQIEAAYRSGDYNFLKLLLNQDHPGRFERLLEYYRHLNEARLSQLRNLHATELELVEVQTNLAAQHTRLAQRRTEQERQRSRLQTQQNEQEQRVAALQAAQSSTSSELQAMLQNEQEMTELLAALADVLRASDINLSGLANLRGKLPWPLSGQLRHRFGEQRSSQVNWRGIVINGTAEVPVRSIADGRVLFADWLRGFGLVIVLDHGEGFMSLYGYNQALMFDVGEAVRQGQIISLVGQSGGQSEPGLYFEIRHRGDPVNPSTYLTK